MSILELPGSFTSRVSSMAEPVTLVVNDATRPSPSVYLEALEPFLPGRCRLIFATGAHRTVTEAEREHMAGGILGKVSEIQSNDCDSGEHVLIGTTSRGTPVELHPWLLEGSVLAVNTVEPHYFAGFTGGRKSFLPGCSSRRTITANHYLACLPGSLPGKLDGNPVHSDMAEGVEMLTAGREILMVNGISGGHGFFCGTPDDSFRKAAFHAAERFSVRLREPCDSLEVKPGGALEVSLYQSMKAVFMWEGAVRDGGELVLSSPCPEGLGAPQMERLLRASMGAVAPPASSKEYLLGDHAALRLSIIRRRIRLTFRTWIAMEEYGFGEPPAECADIVEDAGFLYPVMTGENAEHI